MLLILLGMLIAYLITGCFAVAYPSPVSERAYTSGTRFLAWPGVVFPNSPFGAVLAWSLRASK